MREYFSHDYNARNDQKIVNLIMKHKLEGLAIYWCLVEILYECNGYIHEDNIDTIAFELRTESERIANVLATDLFVKKGKRFHSESVLRRINKRKEISDKARSSALSRWNPKDKPDANALRTESERNAIKVKESKVKESKGIIERIKEFEIQILELNKGLKILSDIEVKKFVDYWTEAGDGAKKFRREKQTTWNSKRRLERWNENNFGEKDKTPEIDFQNVDTTGMSARQVLDMMKQKGK